MKNQNESTVIAFDIVYAPYTNEAQTNREIALFQKFCPRGKVLDLGCGTGRHLIALEKRGYRVTGIDSSTAMLSILEKKLKRKKVKAKLVNANIATISNLDKFDGVICFFNAFTEMAKNEAVTRKIFRKLFNSLRHGGTLIIEQTFPTTKDFDKHIYRYKTKKAGKTYEVLYKVLSYNSKTRTSRSLERITISTKKKTKILNAIIIQHWQEKKFLKEAAYDAGFSDIQFFGANFKPFTSKSDKFYLVARKQ